MFQLKRTDPYRILELASIAGFVLVTVIVLLFRPSQATPAATEDTILALEPLVSAMPKRGWAPLTVHFSAFGSLSKDSIIRYEWDLDGNGRFDTDATGTDGYAIYAYNKPGTYQVTVRVTDARGHTATASTAITVRHPAASSVDYWTVFDDSQVRRVDMTITQANWNRLWADPEAKVEVPVDAVIFGERLENVSLKMRGQFSLRESGEKKPWEIDTDDVVPGQEFHNLRQLLFMNNIGDPTMLQEKLAYDMMRFAGVPAGHASFAEVWIDIVDDDGPPTFWGVYTLVERVDRKFLGNRFGQDSKDGNLYKASHAQRGPMDLIYHGPAISDYPTQEGAVAYGKVNNEAEADYRDIVELCYVVDGASYATQEDFAAALETVLNVDDFLRYMAVQVTLANWDYYPYTGNNYYLFHNPLTGRFEWIPWDLTWGGDARQPLFSLEGHQLVTRAPLYDRVFAVERYRRQYAAYVDLLNREWFNGTQVAERTQALYNQLAPYVTQGTGDKMYFGASARFPYDEFENGWQSLAQFAAARSAYIRQELNAYTVSPGH